MLSFHRSGSIRTRVGYLNSRLNRGLLLLCKKASIHQSVMVWAERNDIIRMDRAVFGSRDNVAVFDESVEITYQTFQPIYLLLMWLDASIKSFSGWVCPSPKHGVGHITKGMLSFGSFETRCLSNDWRPTKIAGRLPGPALRVVSTFSRAIVYLCCGPVALCLKCFETVCAFGSYAHLLPFLAEYNKSTHECNGQPLLSCS